VQEQTVQRRGVAKQRETGTLQQKLSEMHGNPLERVVWDTHSISIVHRPCLDVPQLAHHHLRSNPARQPTDLPVLVKVAEEVPYICIARLNPGHLRGAVVSEFGLSGKYFIIQQSQFHFSSRVPGLAGHLPMPSVDALSPVISVSSCFALRL
jgi:hypothetical protein